MPETVGILRRYTIRKAQPDKATLEVTFPFEVAEREARKKGMSLEDFLAQYEALVEFDDSPVVRYTFVPKQ